MVLNNFGKIAMLLSTHCTAHLSNLAVNLEISSSLGLGGISNLISSLHCITQRWRRPWYSPSSFWTYCCARFTGAEHLSIHPWTVSMLPFLSSQHFAAHKCISAYQIQRVTIPISCSDKGVLFVIFHAISTHYLHLS